MEGPLRRVVKALAWTLCEWAQRDAEAAARFLDSHRGDLPSLAMRAAERALASIDQ
jgi:hypothetical protein